MKLSEAIVQYLDYLKRKNYGKLTITAYSLHLHTLLKSLRDIDTSEINIDLITKTLSAHYKICVSKSHNLNYGTKGTQGIKPSSYRQHLISLRQFLRYLAKHDMPCLSPDKIALSKMIRPKPIGLTYDETMRLFLVINTLSAIETVNIRNRAILETLYCSGLPVTMLISLKKSSIDWHAKKLFHTDNDGSKRLAYLSDSAIQWIKSWIDCRNDDDDLLFVNADGRKRKKGTPLTRQNVNLIINKAAKMAGIENKSVSPKTLRHNFAMTLFDKGASIEDVRTMMGHKHLCTTQIYLCDPTSEHELIHRNVFN